MLATRTLTAAALAALVALTAFTVQPVPATAAGPAPSAAPVASPAPTADPSPAASPSAAPAASPSAAPAATTSPAPVAPTRAQVLASRLQLAARIAITKLRGRYAYGASGPSTFDCSGLVRYAYRRAGIASRIGGGHSARGMLLWGRLHHLTSPRNPQVGDVAVWGNGTHVGIYIGGGRVISALNPRMGIKITGIHALMRPFTTFIHTGL